MKRLKEYLNEEEKIRGTSQVEPDKKMGITAYGKLASSLHEPKEMSGHEVNLLDAYTGYNHSKFKADGFALSNDLNGYLRSGGGVMHTRIIPSLDKHVKSFDSLIDKHKTKHAVHLWRGITDAGKSDSNATFMDKMQPGTEFHDKGFLSTTIRPATAGRFGRYRSHADLMSGKPFNKHVIHFVLPKGSKALSVGAYPDRDTQEHEVILPRNSKFRYSHKEVFHHAGQNSIYHIHHLQYLGQHNE
jgi:hypothetical protein